MMTPSEINAQTRSHSPGVVFLDVHGSSLNIAIREQLSMVYSAGLEKRSSCCMGVDELFKPRQVLRLQAQIVGCGGIRDLPSAIGFHDQRAEGSAIFIEWGGRKE